MKGLKLCPRAKVLSSTRLEYTASPGRRSRGSETGGRSPPAAACKSTLTSAARVLLCVRAQICELLTNAETLKQNIFHFRELNKSSIQNSEFLQSPSHTHTHTVKLCRMADERMLARALCSSLNHLSVIRPVIISLLLTLQAE